MVLGLFVEGYDGHPNKNGTVTYTDCVWVGVRDEPLYPMGTRIHEIVLDLRQCLLLIRRNEQDMPVVYRFTVNVQNPSGHTPRDDIAEIATAPKRRKGDEPTVQAAGAEASKLLQTEMELNAARIPATGTVEQATLRALGTLHDTASRGNPPAQKK